MDRRGFLRGTIAAIAAARFGKLPAEAPFIEAAAPPVFGQLVGSSKLLYAGGLQVLRVPLERLDEIQLIRL